MRILFVTEGTYPHVMGGVSTWCDQLINGLEEHTFTVMTVTGPLVSEAVYPRPKNVNKLVRVPIWKEREGTRAANRQDRAAFDEALEHFLGFIEKDMLSFARGLRELAALGDTVNLWPLFEQRSVWRTLHARLRRQLPYTPPLAEIALCANWLKSAIVPLLFMPPKADLIHTVSNGLGAVPAWLAAKAHGVPLVLTEHGVYLRERYLGFSDEDEPPAVKTMRAAFYQTLSRLMYQHADRVLSVSEFNRQWQLELGAPSARTQVIPNGVDPNCLVSASAASPKGTSDRDPTVVWVGRIDPLKDLETLVKAFATVCRTLPNARLKLYGPVPKGNEDYFERVASLIRKLHMTRNIHFTGPVSPVQRAFEGADLMALSSVSEGFPYTVIEAMMCARPVVATRVGGVGEAVADTGRLVPSQRPDKLASALLELLTDPELTRTLGQHARQRALDYFTLDRMLMRYHMVYQALFAPETVSFDDAVVLLKDDPEAEVGATAVPFGTAENPVLVHDDGL